MWVMMPIKWIDLFQFLNQRANDINNLEKFDWQSPVIIHNAENGDEFNCDTYYINDSRGDNRFVLAINMESVFN